MTTFADQPAYREWRVNRIRAAMNRISVACANPRISRTEAQVLAQALHDVADEVADCFICPAGQHLEGCGCGKEGKPPC